MVCGLTVHYRVIDISVTPLFGAYTFALTAGADQSAIPFKRAE